MERIGVRGVDGRLCRHRAAKTHGALDSVEGAHLHAERAAIAQARIHKSLTTRARLRTAQPLIEADARAPDGGDALLAAGALVGIDRHWSIGLLQLNARRTEDDGRGPLVVDGRAGRRHGAFQTVRIREPDVLDAEAVQHFLNDDGAAALAHERDARTRVGLTARHGRGGIVQDSEGDVVAVVHCIRDTGHSAGEERGVAHESHLLLVRLGHRETLSHSNARAHAQAGVHGIERLGVAERVAADVPAQHGLATAERLLHGIEAAAVRAARAQHRRPHG